MALEAGQLFQYALRALAARALTTAELRKKLETRAERAEDVDAVIARLKEYRYLDDRGFAEAYSAARLESSGFGRQRVLRDLRRRRVAPGLAREAVEKAYSNADEPAMIEDFLRRKFRGVDLERHLAEPRHLASAYRRLRTAGFAPTDIIRVLKRYSEDAGALEE